MTVDEVNTMSETEVKNYLRHLISRLELEAVEGLWGGNGWEFALGMEEEEE